jgi:hypothetical protein
MKDFWIELWSYVTQQDTVLPSKLIKNIYDLGRRMRKSSEVDSYWSLCRYCKETAFRLKKRLPESLHNRMVLGIQNDHTKNYVKRWGV